MSRARKASTRVASRRRQAASSSPRQSHQPAAQLALPASATPMQIRKDAPRKDANCKDANCKDAPMPSDASPTHQDRRAHPDQAALKERAFALSCLGHRSPAIAIQLGIPERTIRHWLNSTLSSLAQNPDGAGDSGDPGDTGDIPADTPTAAGYPFGAADQLERLRALAIERQLTIALTARAAYDRIMARHDLLLDHLTNLLLATPSSTAEHDNLSNHGARASLPSAPAPMPATSVASATSISAASEEPAGSPSLAPAAALMARLIPQLGAAASRQLHIAQVAHREVARLQGVTTYAQTGAHLTATAEHAAVAAGEAGAQQEPGGHIPIRFFDAKAALDAICGPDPDPDPDPDDAPAAATALPPAQHAPCSPAATSPATPATKSATPATPATPATKSATPATNPTASPLSRPTDEGWPQTGMGSPSGPTPRHIHGPYTTRERG